MRNEPNYHFDGEEAICSPQLIYYPEMIRENIEKMKEMAGGCERLWPHVKTHKMESVAKMLLEAGIRRLKCATLAELEMAARANAPELLLAYPLVGPNIERFLELCRAFPQTQIYAVGDDTEQVSLLGRRALRLGMTVSLLMDVDLGQHRTGVALSKVTETYRRWSTLAGIRMRGLHCYDGHRREHDLRERLAAAAPGDREIARIQARLTEGGLDCGIVVLGGTPSFPCHRQLSDAYLSPGTCVIQDAGYLEAYPDLPFRPGAAVLTRVISRPLKNTFTLDLGTKAVASDPPVPRVRIAGMAYAQTVLHNEEHLVLQVPENYEKEIPPVGSILYAVPVHICPTTALYARVPAVENGRVTDWWEVTARR